MNPPRYGSRRVGVVAGVLDDVVQDRDHLGALPVGTGRIGDRHQLVQVVVTASFVDLALVCLHGEEVGGGDGEQHGWAPPGGMETSPLREGRRCGSPGSSTRSPQGTTSGRTDCRPVRSAARLPTSGTVGRPPPAVPLRPTRPRSAGADRRGCSRPPTVTPVRTGRSRLGCPPRGLRGEPTLSLAPITPQRGPATERRRGTDPTRHRAPRRDAARTVGAQRAEAGGRRSRRGLPGAPGWSCHPAPRCRRLPEFLRPVAGEVRGPCRRGRPMTESSPGRPPRVVFVCAGVLGLVASALAVPPAAGATTTASCRTATSAGPSANRSPPPSSSLPPTRPQRLCCPGPPGPSASTGSSDRTPTCRAPTRSDPARGTALLARRRAPRTTPA